MQSPSHRIYGLGIGADTGFPHRSPYASNDRMTNRRSAPAPLPQTQSPFTGSREDDNPPSPAPYTTPQRFRIANPDPSSELSEDEDVRRDVKPPAQTQNRSSLNNLQARAAAGFALRPTHTKSPARPQVQTGLTQSEQGHGNSFAAMGNSLAGHSPQLPADPFAKALAPLDSNGNRMRHSRGMSEPPQAAYGDTTFNSSQDALLPNNGGLKSSAKHQIRSSRSSEFLRRLRAGSEEPARKTTPYQALTDEELDDDEVLRLPKGGVRATNSSARTFAPHSPQTHWSSSNERLAGDFPPPPQQIPEAHTGSGEGSADTFTTANSGSSQANSTSSGHSGSSTKAVKGIPWPMAAKAGPSAPATSNPNPLAASHSQRSTLLAAETGGMLVLNNASRTYSPGNVPGQLPPVSAVAGQRHPSSRHPNRKSTGDLNFGQEYANYARQQQRSQIPVAATTPRSSRNSASDSDSRGSGAPLTRRGHVRSNSDGLALLARTGTLFHPASSDARASQELDVMLGKPKSRRLSATTLLPAPETPTKDKVRLEASKKGRARVELDVVIERECIVEGGELRGRLEVVVRGGKRGNGLRVGAGKLRVLGYEEIVDGSKSNRHIFYQHQHLLPEFFDERDAPVSTLFASDADDEGFRLAKEGTHALPFSMSLPVNGGAKGAFTGEKGKGPNIKYVVVGSVKLHIPKTGKRAIAHFYRPIVLLPYHNPAKVLSPARTPVVEFIESRLGWSLIGEKGKVFLQVSLGRQTWVAGQRVWCEVGVRNNSNKKITKCSLAILQTISTFGVPKGKNTSEFLDLTRKKVSEEITEADFMDVGSGHVTSKSWWTGLEPGESNRWDMSVPIPTGMISIPRSRLVEIGYVLRVTLNNSIYVDVPVDLINFLSVDPPPMPSDARRQRIRMAVSGSSGTVKAGIASTLPPPQEVRQEARQATPVQQPVQAAPKPYGPTIEGAGYTIEQLKGEPQDTQQAARSSSTTLNIDELLEQGRARASEESARAQDAPTDGTQYLMPDLNPRPLSPASKYSSIGTAYYPTMNGQRGQRDVSGGPSEAGSIDDEERNHLAVEAHRRDGRSKSLAVIGDGGVETLTTPPTPNPADGEDASVVHSSLEPHEIKTYRPAEEPSGTAFEFDKASDDGHDTSPFSRSANPTPRPEQQAEAEAEEGSEDDNTPKVSPVLSPILSPNPVQHPIAKFLHHISEEEEPLTDDMLDDMVSLDDQESGGLRYIGSNDGEFDEDLVAANDEHDHDETPRVSTVMSGRPSLEERLAMACTSPTGAVVQKAKTAVMSEARELSPKQNSGGFSPPNASVREFGARPKSVDYAEPLDIDDLTITSMATSVGKTETDDGYEAMSEQSSIASRGTAKYSKHRANYSLPAGWSDPPYLPPPSSARDISWGGNLAGRTVSGHTAVVHLGDSSPEQPTVARWPTGEVPAPSPRSATFGERPASPPPAESKQPSRQEMLLAATQAGMGSDTEDDDDNDEDLQPPNALRRIDTTTPSEGSFRTARSGDDLPGLKRSTDSESSDDQVIESPPTVSQPLYTTPLPVTPGGSQRASLMIPDRFRPMAMGSFAAAPLPAMSEDSHVSHMSTASSSASHDSNLLPAVKARVQQFETREEALRKFTVASSAGLHSPTLSQGPLSPMHTSSGSSSASHSHHSHHSHSGWHGSHVSTASAPSPSGRRSYTSALAPRMPGTFSSPRSATAALDTATGEFTPRHSAGTPTSSVSSVRRAWELREEHELSGSASKLLNRALSNSSASTSATDIERALSPTGSRGPRGPRPPSRARAAPPSPINVSLSNRDSHSHSGSSNLSMAPSMTSTASLDPPTMPPQYRHSPAQTPTKEQAFLPDVMSETASVDGMSHESHAYGSEEHISSGSEFGNMRWTGAGGLRLPPLRQAVPMPAFGRGGPRTPNRSPYASAHATPTSSYGYSSARVRQ